MKEMLIENWKSDSIYLATSFQMYFFVILVKEVT